MSEREEARRELVAHMADASRMLHGGTQISPSTVRGLLAGLRDAERFEGEVRTLVEVEMPPVEKVARLRKLVSDTP